MLYIFYNELCQVLLMHGFQGPRCLGRQLLLEGRILGWDWEEGFRSNALIFGVVSGLHDGS